MADIEKAAGELGAKAAFAAAKDAAERAIEDALLSDEERAARKAEQAALAKRKRKKAIAFGVVGLLLVLGLIGMVLSYWQWFFLAGLVGVAALYARHRWKKARSAKRESAEEAKPERKPERVRAEAPRELPPARVAASAEDEKREIEDELAALKARAKK